MRSAAASAPASSPQPQRKVRIAHILVPSDRASLLAELQAELEQGGSKATFAELAAKHSICGVSRHKGGEVGWISRGTFFPEVEAAALATPVGGYAQAASGRGAHLVTVLEERMEAPVGRISAQELAELLANPAMAQEVRCLGACPAGAPS